MIDNDDPTDITQIYQQVPPNITNNNEKSHSALGQKLSRLIQKGPKTVKNCRQQPKVTGYEYASQPVLAKKGPEIANILPKITKKGPKLPRKDEKQLKDN